MQEVLGIHSGKYSEVQMVVAIEQSTENDHTRAEFNQYIWNQHFVENITIIL